MQNLMSHPLYPSKTYSFNGPRKEAITEEAYHCSGRPSTPGNQASSGGGSGGGGYSGADGVPAAVVIMPRKEERPNVRRESVLMDAQVTFEREVGYPFEYSLI